MSWHAMFSVVRDRQLWYQYCHRLKNSLVVCLNVTLHSTYISLYVCLSVCLSSCLPNTACFMDDMAGLVFTNLSEKSLVYTMG